MHFYGVWMIHRIQVLGWHGRFTQPDAFLIGFGSGLNFEAIALIRFSGIAYMMLTLRRLS